MSTVSWKKEIGILVRQSKGLAQNTRTAPSPHLRRPHFCLYNMHTVRNTEYAFPLCIF